MLVRFSIQNWMSFRDKATFSMEATRERQHGDRVPKLGRYKTKILPIAAIYGGNASGKTNFFKALNFAKTLIVYGTRPNSLIPVEPFLLNAETVLKPSRFEFVLLVGETMYEYGFAVTRKAVLEEKLVKINGNGEKVIFHRRNREPNFHDTLAKKPFLDFAFRGTRDNQLFLTNSVSQNIDTFRPVYDWFDDTLELIAPDSRFSYFEHFLDEGHPLYSIMNHTLPLLDTGIARIGGVEIPFDNLPIPEPLKSQLQEEVRDGMIVRLLTEPMFERFMVARKNGNLIAKKLIAYHSTTDGSEVKFEMRQESDGSRRVIDILPAFLSLASDGSKKVYVIDEVERSLHTLLVRRMIETYLDNCSVESRMQLLLTTHDVLLMDQQIMRRDEMWVTERDVSGTSSMTSFSDYLDIRYDKDIRKSYLQGRLGGIPRIMLSSSLSEPRISKESGEGI